MVRVRKQKLLVLAFIIVMFGLLKWSGVISVNIHPIIPHMNYIMIDPIAVPVQTNLNQTNMTKVTTALAPLDPRYALADGEAKLGSRSKSIIFIKAYKVGGTTMTSILTAFAMNTNQAMQTIDQWCMGKPITTRNGHCADIIGTNHPPQSQCLFPRIEASNLCNPPQIFMLIRKPVERLWSGYLHEVKIAGGKPFSLSRFLNSSTSVKIPSNRVLHKSVDQAIEKASQINILLTELFDESLVYMAKKSGLKLCDIMYVPCELNAQWGSTKCNNLKSNITMSTEEQLQLNKTAEKTDETQFYESLYTNASKKLQSKEIQDLTKKYRTMRIAAYRHCNTPEAIRAVEGMMAKHPYVTREGKGEKLWHYLPEKTNPLDPLIVCLGWHCQEKG